MRARLSKLGSSMYEAMIVLCDRGGQFEGEGGFGEGVALVVEESDAEGDYWIGVLVDVEVEVVFADQCARGQPLQGARTNQIASIVDDDPGRIARHWPLQDDFDDCGFVA